MGFAFAIFAIAANRRKTILVRGFHLKLYSVSEQKSG
jgi:hypothetical protein